MVISRVAPKELIRIKNCQGCMYLATAEGGSLGSCNYIFMADRPRSGKFADPNCSVKVVNCNQTALEAVLAKTNKIIKKLENLDAEENAPKWDVELARKMYDAGIVWREIAEKTGVSITTMASYAAAHNWPARKRGRKGCSNDSEY